MVEIEKELAQWWYNDDTTALRKITDSMIRHLPINKNTGNLVRIIGGMIGAVAGTQVGGPFGTALSTTISLGITESILRLNHDAKLGQVLEVFKSRILSNQAIKSQ